MYCTNQTEADPDHPGQKRLIWQQMKIGCVYWQDAHEHWHKQMVWGRESPDLFGAALWRVACQCPLDQLHDGGGAALAAWLTTQRPSRRGRPRAALEDLSRYVTDKLDRMNYPAARECGWPIGTGMIESTCKQLVGQRLKGPGRHWTESGALAITALRATDLNGRWNSFWNTLTLAN